MKLTGVVLTALVIAPLGPSLRDAVAHPDSRSSQAAAQGRSVWDGVYTDGQANRGGQLYRERCATCHGSAFEGDGESPSLVGESFTSEWQTRSLGQLFERVRRTMPDDDPGVLSDQDYADLIARLLNANKYPAGPTELPPSQATLNGILFTPKAP